MFSKIKNGIQKRNKDNKGAALVMVIVAISFIGMLVAMILYMAYCNYLMKMNDRVAKDNFYSAEYALDVINAGLQHDVSDSMSAAYVQAMQMSTDQSPEEMTIKFQTYYVNELMKRVCVASDQTKWDISHLKGMWTADGVKVATGLGVEGAHLQAEPSTTNSFTNNITKGYVALENVYIVYTDSRGYVSIITTDIRLMIPDIDFAKSSAKLNVENYSLVANDSLVNSLGKNVTLPSGVAATSGANVNISGNVFGGYDGIVLDDQFSMSFIQSPSDNTPGATYSYNLVADSINVENVKDNGAKFSVDGTFDTYVDNISVVGSRLDMAGKMYVGDDMDISGSQSDVTLSGIYRGYGNALGKADGSSAILINGGDTELDFSGLTELVLSGHAYVGAKKYDADADRLAYVAAQNLPSGTQVTAPTTDDIDDAEAYEDAVAGYTATDDTIPQNTTDVLTGESISVKANQLLYMVPSECIGYEVGTDRQVIAKNPMTYSEYTKLTTAVTNEPETDDQGNELKDASGNTVYKKKYEPVRLSVLWNKIGTTRGFTDKYKAVYRRVNGTVMVYLYLDFGTNEMMANSFYKAYYDYDKTGIQNYVDSYIASLAWNDSLETSDLLTLGGNAFKLDANGDVVFVDNSMLDSDKVMNVINMKETHSEAYMSLMHSLSADARKLTSTQKNSEIFDSLVDASKLSTLNGINFSDGTVAAKISTSDVVYPDGCAEGSNTKLIVTDKDIYLTADFEGLAIAGGNIYICNGCTSVNYDPTDVLSALRLSDTSTGTTLNAYDVFGLSGQISYALVAPSTSTDETIRLSDLVVYQNWKKE